MGRLPTVDGGGIWPSNGKICHSGLQTVKRDPGTAVPPGLYLCNFTKKIEQANEKKVDNEREINHCKLLSTTPHDSLQLYLENWVRKHIESRQLWSWTNAKNHLFEIFVRERERERICIKNKNKNKKVPCRFLLWKINIR